MRVFGARLRTVPSRSVEKAARLLRGIGVTALVQSSNATTMLVTSFVAQDLVCSRACAGDCAGCRCRDGADGAYSHLRFITGCHRYLFFIGVIFFLGRKQSRAGQLGRVGIGLGLILLALELIVAGRNADHSGKRRSGDLCLADWRHFAGCADWCDVRHYQLLQPARYC